MSEKTCSGHGKEDKSQAEDCLNRKTSQDSTTSVSSSGGSNKSNQQDDPKISLLFEYSELNDIIQEVDKPDHLLVIPFDSYPKIWSYLDGANENSSASSTEEESDHEDVSHHHHHHHHS
ncbi:hypothetical protein Bca52824_025176 [Brassica carinata]|uniref:Uncharacterized protein n=1 Tax=Brassica carinata TaxID=52824 RepID=A0A8X7VLD3_BRACI|nr:hypothetical protein Bca52824_025176 [Brassica carinata]